MHRQSNLLTGGMAKTTHSCLALSPEQGKALLRRVEGPGSRLVPSPVVEREIKVRRSDRVKPEKVCHLEGAARTVQKSVLADSTRGPPNNTRVILPGLGKVDGGEVVETAVEKEEWAFPLTGGADDQTPFNGLTDRDIPRGGEDMGARQPGLLRVLQTGSPDGKSPGERKVQK